MKTRDNMVERAEIQDVLVYQEDVEFVQGALDFFDHFKIENDDITILNNQEALKQGIENLLRTPTGIIDGAGVMARFGTDFLTLRGQPINYHTVELAKKYIRDTIPQLNGKVNSIEIDVFNPRDDTKNIDPYGRFTMGFILTVDSVYGDFRFPVLL